MVGVILATFLRGADRTDLDIFLKAAHNLETGQPVYSLADANEHTKPPLATALFIPLTHVNAKDLGQCWDGMNIALMLALTFFFARALKLRTPPARATWVLLMLLWLLNPWNKEIRLGQYNLLTFTFILVAGFGPRIFSGMLATLAILIKPTNVFFLPWVMKRRPQWRALAAGAGITVIFLSGYYVAHAGWAALFADHQTWLHTLPLSAAKHLHRTDNYGLVRLLDEANAPQALRIAQFAGAALVLISAYFMDWATALSAAAIVGIALSPMAWFQNYVLLLPWVALLFSRSFSAQVGWAERTFSRLALFFLYAGMEIFPAFAGQGLLKQYSDLPIPIWVLAAATVAWACALGLSPLRARAKVATVAPEVS